MPRPQRLLRTFDRKQREARMVARGCGAGGRYLYICEDGLVHWCSQQHGHPGTPLAEYTTEDVLRESTSERSCAPFCTVSCVHRVALLDRIRTQPIATLDEMMPAGASGPTSVRALRWMFVTGRYHDRFRAPSPRACSARVAARPWESGPE